MSGTHKRNVTSETAFDLIMSGQPLSDLFIVGELKLIGLDNFDKSLIAINCIFEYVNAASSQFAKVVKFTECELRKCDFTFSYFFGGLEIDKCVFENYLDFQAGGHNKRGNVVSIGQSSFKGFVNFFDCWYESAVIIQNNNFLKGTNLLGETNGIRTTFDVKPIIQDNTGKLDVNGEGDIESKVI